MSSPSFSKNEGNDAWLMKIELKREEPGEINKDDGIKKALGDQVLAVAEEDILPPHHNLFTPVEIEAFKMIELARIQNKYLTSDLFFEGAYHRTQRHYPQVRRPPTLDV